MPEDTALYAPQQPVHTGLRGRCPQCGQGRIFDGFLKVAPRCRACGLDLSFADAADGPAVFVILIVGFVVAAAALIVEVSFMPPVLVHILLWGPLVAILSLALLRPLKGVLIALQFVNRAREGELDRRG